MTEEILELLNHKDLQVPEADKGNYLPDSFSLRIPLPEKAEHPATRQKIAEYFKPLATYWERVAIAATNRSEGSSLKISVNRLKIAAFTQCQTCAFWDGGHYPQPDGRMKVLVCFPHPSGPNSENCPDWAE
jgi:hypothetical protein